MVQSPWFWLTLVATVPLYWASPPARRPWVLALGSAALLCTLAPWVVLGLAAWTGLLVPRLRSAGPRPWLWLFLGGLAAQLVAFKLLALVPSLDEGLVAPLGVSFFTFRLVHYGVETARGTLPPHRTADVLAWIFFFPVFTAGPIARFDTFQRHAETRWSGEATVAGLTRMAQGIVKRFVLAELLDAGTQKGTAGEALLDQLDVLGAGAVWLAVVASFLHVWLDFSGYTDIALGAARLYGLRIEENFDWPILARDPADFWRRWHKSLSGWCQTYLFFPLLGATRRPTLATILTFTVMGLWHAVSIHWVFWGVYHGVAVGLTGLVQRELRRRGHAAVRPALAWVGVPSTFLFVSSAHAFTVVDRAGTGWDAVRVFGRLFGVHL